MSKFCVVPGVSSKVASHLLVEELYTRTIPFDNVDALISLSPDKVPEVSPAIEETTFIEFFCPTRTLMSAIRVSLVYVYQMII